MTKHTHHAEENGIDKAIDDAHIKVAELYLQRDELLAALEAIRRGDDNPCHIASEAIAKSRGMYEKRTVI